MSEVTALNYKALGISGTTQLGSDSTSSSSTNFTDGLTASELSKIDADGDGVITEAEFKAVYKGSNADACWEEYVSYYSAKTTTKSDGSYTVTQTLSDGTVVKSSYDKSGNLTGYTKTTTNSSGLSTVIKYDADGNKTSKTTENSDGSTTKIKYDSDGNKVSKTTTLEDGSSSTYNYSKKTWTHKAADGSSVTTDSSGNITKVSAGDTEVSVKYASDGTTPKSITVNGTKYTNIKVSSSGKITVKDDDGNTVLTINEESSGKTKIVRYENGEKAEKIELNSDKEPNSIYTYDDNGYTSSRTFCNTGRVRYYTRNSDGTLKSSTDYDKNGVLLSEQTYVENGSSIFANNNAAQWATRIFYNSDGSVSKYETYTYKTNDGGQTVLKTTNKYSDTSMSSLISTTYTDMDSYANKLESTTENYEKGTTSTTTYNYSENGVYYDDVNYKTAKVSKKHLTSTVTVTTTDTEIITTTKEYSNGKVVNVTTESEEISSSSTSSTSSTDNDSDTSTNSNSDDEYAYTETTDENGNVISGSYTLKALLQKLYPNMWTKQLDDIADALVEKDGLSKTAMYDYDWTTGTCEIDLPNIYDAGYGIYKAEGYTDSDLY